MRNQVKEDPGVDSRVVIQWTLLIPNTQKTRKARGQKLLNKLKASQHHQVWIFSDEKIFTGDVAVNRRNSHYLTDVPVADVDPSIPIFPKSKAPLKQMVLTVLRSDGQKCPIIFIGAS
jgi:hypothetical protein